MSLKNDPDDLRENGKVGDWCFYNNPHENQRLYIYLMYPYGDSEHGELVTLPIESVPNPNAQDWQWDGNREAPTLSPSIRVLNTHEGELDRWHGYLKAGKIETA